MKERNMTEKAFLTEILALLRMGKADAAVKAIGARMGKCKDGGVTTNSGGVPPQQPPPDPTQPDG